MVELKLSCITDEFSDEFDEVCEYLQSKDMEFVELRNVWMGNVIEIDDQMVGDSLDVLSDCGLKVSALATPLLKCLPPSVNPHPKHSSDYTENWQYNFSKIDRAVELAEKYHCDYIRVFGFQGKWPIEEVENWDTWQIYSEWKDTLQMMKQKAATKGKTLICENESGLCSSFEQMERLGKDNCDDQFGLLYDTANVANSYGQFGVLDEEWRGRLTKYIKYIHAKGCVMGPKGTYTSYVNDDGCFLRWPELVEHFRNTSPSIFIGKPPVPLFLSIETHMEKEGRWEKSTKSLENLRKLINP
jgi:sugar phosphate isomerase/epimerase